LLYAQKGEITSKDILIISPNKVFADYVFHLTFTDAILSFERNVSLNLSGWGGIGSGTQFMVIKHTGYRSPPIVN